MGNFTNKDLYKNSFWILEEDMVDAALSIIDDNSFGDVDIM